MMSNTSITTKDLSWDQPELASLELGVVKRPLTSRVWDALVAPRGTLAYLPIILAALVMSYASSWQLFWNKTDEARYQCYALSFWFGSDSTSILPASHCLFYPQFTTPVPALHMLPLEYPPLTLALFSLGLFGPLAYYQMIFAFFMALSAVLLYWLLLRYGPRGAALLAAIFLALGAATTTELRYDVVPALLTLVCVIAADRRRWTVAYVALAFGVLLKIYPILLWPLLLLAEQRAAGRLRTPTGPLNLRTLPRELIQTLLGMRSWRWRNSLIFGGLLVAITGFFAIFDFQGAVIAQFSYFSKRPLQVEALGSTFVWIGSRLGIRAYIVDSFGSTNVVSHLAPYVSLLCTFALILGYGVILWFLWYGRLSLSQACLAAVMVFVATGKVFSPQYLIWIIPLLVYVTGWNRFWLLAFGVVCVLTTIIYPFCYFATPSASMLNHVLLFLPSVALRNGLLLLLTVGYLFNWRGLRGPVLPVPRQTLTA